MGLALCRNANPQHFVPWILKGAQFRDALSIELKNWTRETDFLLDVILDGLLMLLHIEFQSTDDADGEDVCITYVEGTRPTENGWKGDLLCTKISWKTLGFSQYLFTIIKDEKKN